MDPSLLAFNRSAIEARFDSEAIVLQRSAGTSDGMGGTMDVEWTPTGATFPCLLQDMSRKRERESDDAVSTRGVFRISLPWNAGVTLDHRLEIDDVVYELQATNEDIPERYALHLEGLVSR